jgi:hypothetical protein
MTRMASAGFKVAGGGPHQSKTMMLAEFSTVSTGALLKAKNPRREARVLAGE